jgi:hypothetical protein
VSQHLVCSKQANVWPVRSRLALAIAIHAQLEQRDWNCFFRPCMLNTTDFRKTIFRYSWLISTIPDTIYRACGWMMGLKHVQHVCEVQYSLVMPIEAYRLCLSLNNLSPPPSCLALQPGAFARSSGSNAHYGCDWCRGISLCFVWNKPSFRASHLILNAVIEWYICFGSRKNLVK